MKFHFIFGAKEGKPLTLFEEWEELFSKNHFRCITEKMDYKEVLYSMAQDVVDDEACSPTFPDDVWERESCLSTIYKNGVAIPHPIEMTGNKNLISVALVQTDIESEGKTPKVIQI